MTGGSPSPELSLAAALQRLEEIVRALEAEDADLDRALALFEEGVAVLRETRERIADVELRIQRVVADASGDIRIADLDV